MLTARLLFVLTCLATPLAAQAPPVPTGLSRPQPLTYFFRSFLLPGSAQMQLDRKLTGAIFVTVEGVALGMAIKAHQELGYLERTGSGRAKDKRSERQDWLFLLAVNHLMAGMEAFVSANLYDFPVDLHVTTTPDGSPAMGLSVPLRGGRRGN